MCQMRVVVNHSGDEEVLFEDVTNLVVEPTGLKIATLFEGPKEVENMVIGSIDFTAGKVYLQPGH